MTRLLIALLLPLSFGFASAAESGLELAAPFTNNMILQRQAKVPVWGFDKPGTKVTVEFAGQKQSAVANQRGDWMLALAPLTTSSTERSFKVSDSNGKTIQLSGVLVGEVWFSSGQSNMEWIAGKSMCRGIVKELSSSKTDIPVREISIKTISALYPQKHAISLEGWKKAKEASGFSALSLSFAYSLYQHLHVPIGILLTSQSNTRVEAFTSRASIEANPALKGDAELIHLGDPLTAIGRQAFKQYDQDLRDWEKVASTMSKAGGTIPRRPKLPGIAGMWRGPSQFFNGKINPVVPYAVKGAIWCQGTSNHGDGPIYEPRMEALLSGWRKAWKRPDMPFYFTQMQCYGPADSSPDQLGFANLRQAQFEFFLHNRHDVGMVVQTDLNSAHPGGIHYYNKLHPGMRLARWALAKDYGKDIAYTGPIYQGYRVKGDQVIVSFEKDSLFGGLMVGSKGMAANAKKGTYYEPARPTPGAKINHFRLCGKDHKWHAADAKIVGDTVVVTAKTVPQPVGVQYAYCAVPMNSNLYNKAGLPATPFNAIDGKLTYEPAPVRHHHAASGVVKPFLQFSNYLRNGAILQRNRTIPLWGYANAGATVTATLNGIKRTATANKFEQWRMSFPAMPASTQPITLTVETSLGAKREINNLLVGDVWFLSGSRDLNKQMAWDSHDKKAQMPATLPLVREFRMKTSASSFATPRKRWFETGGGRFHSNWLAADFSKGKEGISMFAYHFAKALGRTGIPQGFITMGAGLSGHKPVYSTPLSWTSYDGVSDVNDPAFQARLNELMLEHPESKIAHRALEAHIAAVDADVQTIIDAAKNGEDLSVVAPRRFAEFPVAGMDGKVRSDMIPTYTYNWCVSPFVPMAVAGVIWVPSDANIGPNPKVYAKELEIYAHSLPETFGCTKLPFYYAQPSASLVQGITQPKLPDAQGVTFNSWPKSLKDIATEMAADVK